VNEHNNVIFFVYNHEKQEFQPSQKQFANAQLFESGDVSQIEKELTKNNIDALLVWDGNKSKWYLVFGSHTGIVVQRTARRHADTMARTGYRGELGKIMPGFPLEELSEANIGDLWKSAQMKYVKTDLKGADVEPPENIKTEKTINVVKTTQQSVQTSKEYLDVSPNLNKERILAPTSSYEPVQFTNNEQIKKEKSEEPPMQEENILTITSVKHFIKGGSTWVVIHVDEAPYKHLPIVFSPSEFDNYTFISKILFLKENDKIIIDVIEKDGLYYAKSLKLPD